MKKIFENITGNTFKVTEHDETDMNNPEEKREVQIGKEIISKTQHLVQYIPQEEWAKLVTPIQALAKELIKMHGVK